VKILLLALLLAAALLVASLAHASRAPARHWIEFHAGLALYCDRWVFKGGGRIDRCDPIYWPRAVTA
jgi:hypothetical protein